MNVLISNANKASFQSDFRICNRTVEWQNAAKSLRPIHEGNCN